jgi:hypothetical protein
MKFFLAIKNFFIEIRDFFISMMTGPGGDISSKRFSGIELINAGIVLGFLMTFIKLQPIAETVFQTLVYAGILLLGGGTIAENIKFGKKDGEK